MQFDKGYISPYFVTDAESMEAVLEDAYVLLHHAEDQRDRGPAAAAGEGPRGRQAAADHRRGRRGPGAVDAGGQLDPQDRQGRRGQGAVLRRPPQGVHAGPRDRHRRRGDRPRGRAQAVRGRARRARHRSAGSWSPRTTPPSSTAAGRGRDQGPGRADPQGDRGLRLRLGQGEAAASGWPSCPAASR